MKKPNFSLEKFDSSNVVTLEAQELSLVIGATAVVGMCSYSGDTDEQSVDCSYSSDTDDKKQQELE
jgi:hypothetical protein